MTSGCATPAFRARCSASTSVRVSAFGRPAQNAYTKGSPVIVVHASPRSIFSIDRGLRIANSGSRIGDCRRVADRGPRIAKSSLASGFGRTEETSVASDVNRVVVQQARAFGRDVVADVESRHGVETVDERARVQVADGAQADTGRPVESLSVALIAVVEGRRAHGARSSRGRRPSEGPATTPSVPRGPRMSKRPLRSTGS